MSDGWPGRNEGARVANAESHRYSMMKQEERQTALLMEIRDLLTELLKATRSTYEV